METEETHVAGVQKLVEELAESLILGKADSYDAPTSSLLTSSHLDTATAGGETQPTGKGEVPQIGASPPVPSVPDALIGIGLGHHHLESATRTADLVQDEDDFGMEALHKVSE